MNIIRRIAPLSLLCLFSLSIVRAQPASPPPQPTIEKGEIEIEGRLSRLVAAQGVAVMRVAAVTLPDGTVATFTEPRVKQIILPTDSDIAAFMSARLAEALHVGAMVRIVGRNTGDGNPLPARAIVVVPPATPESVPMPTIEHPYAQFVEALTTSPQTEATLAAGVLAFCRKNLGRQVGSGQCAALTEAALRAVGAHRRFADYPGDEDYVWGRLIFGAEYRDGRIAEYGSVEDVRIGDIIQFRDVVFETPQGRWHSKELLAHHTAVIEGISPDRLTFNLLQENDGGKLYVTRGEFRLPNLKAGWFRVYQPVPGPPMGGAVSTRTGAVVAGQLQVVDR